MMNHVLFKKPLTEKIEEYLLFLEIRIQILELNFLLAILFKKLVENLPHKDSP